jgi:hypothetical protein
MNIERKQAAIILALQACAAREKMWLQLQHQVSSGILYIDIEQMPQRKAVHNSAHTISRLNIIRDSTGKIVNIRSSTGMAISWCDNYDDEYYYFGHITMKLPKHDAQALFDNVQTHLDALSQNQV